MVDEGGSERYAGFLAPEPAGSEPDLGPLPGDAEPEPPAPAQGPPAPRHRGFAPPREHETHAPPAQAYPPAQQQLGWDAPPAGAQPGQPHQAWGPGRGQAAPDNGAAVAGLSLSIASGVLLLLSAGTSTIVSIVCAGLGIHYSRQGRGRVDRGQTHKHRGVAQAGFVTGIVTLGLSILCTLLWLLVGILYATDESFRQDLKDELDGGKSDSPGGIQTSLQVGVAAIRLLASIVR